MIVVSSVIFTFSLNLHTQWFTFSRFLKTNPRSYFCCPHGERCGSRAPPWCCERCWCWRRGGGARRRSQDRGQPAARQDTVPDISRSPRQHAVESLKALGEDGGAVVRNTSPTVQGYSKQEENLEKAKKYIIRIKNVFRICQIMNKIFDS